MKAYKGPYKGMSPRQITAALIKKYPGRFYAEHPTSAGIPLKDVRRSEWPDPKKIKHTFSGVIVYGQRIWAFDTMLERDAFIHLWPLGHAVEEPKT